MSSRRLEILFLYDALLFQGCYITVANFLEDKAFPFFVTGMVFVGIFVSRS